MDRELENKKYFDMLKMFVEPLYWQKQYYKYIKVLEPIRIEWRGLSTTVYWDDGTKTTVTLSEDDAKMGNNVYAAFCAAFTKRMLRSNSRIHKLVNESIDTCVDSKRKKMLDEAEEKEKAEKLRREKIRAKKAERKKRIEAEKKAAEERKKVSDENIDRETMIKKLETMAELLHLISDLRRTFP